MNLASTGSVAGDAPLIGERAQRAQRAGAAHTERGDEQAGAKRRYRSSARLAKRIERREPRPVGGRSTDRRAYAKTKHAAQNRAAEGPARVPTPERPRRPTRPGTHTRSSVHVSLRRPPRRAARRRTRRNARARCYEGRDGRGGREEGVIRSTSRLTHRTEWREGCPAAAATD